VTIENISRKPDGVPEPDETGDDVSTCFELVDALGGLFIVDKRSGTLDGSIPLRAAQGCKPFLAGNEAGFQLRVAQPARVRLVGDEIELNVSAQAAAKIGGAYDDSLDRVVSEGLLARDGYWHHALRQGVAWRERDRVCLWTGLLVRASPGVRVLQTGAFNRRVRTTIEDCVIADEREFVPVVLELSASSFDRGELWLDTDLACLLPLWTDVDFDVCQIEDAAWVGEELIGFYSKDYNEKRRAGGVTGKYRRLVADEVDNRWDRGGRCRLVFAGPAVHTVESFRRFATAAGVSDVDPSGRGLRFALVRNIAPLSGRFDGLTVREISFDGAGVIARAREQWLSLYGNEGADLFETLAIYANPKPPPRLEPRLLIKTLAFVGTPPGWSSVVDGVHLDVADGLRGVQSTDVFYAISALLQFLEPSSFTITTGEPLARVLPVPRAVLRAPFKTLTSARSAA
jgi:hypothetical protein